MVIFNRIKIDDLCEFSLLGFFAICLLSLSTVFPMPLTPIMAIFFCGLVFLKKYQTKSLSSFPSSFGCIEKLFLGNFLFFLLWTICQFLNEGEVNSLVMNSLRRGTVFTITLFFLWWGNVRLAEDKLLKLFYGVGIFIAVAGLFKIFAFYFLGIHISGNHFSSIFVVDYNMASIPMLLSMVVLIFKSLKDGLVCNRVLMILVVNFSIYFSASRRAFLVLLGLLVLGVTLSVVRKRFKQVMLYMMLIIFATPFFNPDFLIRVSKSVLHYSGASEARWAFNSPLCLIRYYSIFGVKKDVKQMELRRRSARVFGSKKSELDEYVNFSLNDKVEFTSGGRLAKWVFLSELYSQYPLINKVLGNGFSYHDLYAKKFRTKFKDYPHLMGASVLLYGGVLGLTIFLCLYIYSFSYIIKKSSKEILVCFSIVSLFWLISMDILFSHYIPLFFFSIPMIARVGINKV